MAELVSIIIPAYNAERWIADTIRSAIGQTWPNKEVIIVDDGSIDNTLAIAKAFESKLVTVVTQEHKGASAARNRGLRLAQGSYIQWLDADDLLLSNKIANQLKYAESGLVSNTFLTSSFGTIFFCLDRAKVRPTALWQDLSPVDWLLAKFCEKVWMNPATWLVSRKLTDQVGPWNEGLVRDNDGEYVCRVVVASDKVRFVREAMSFYRVCNLGSLSYSYSDRACESMVQSFTLCFGLLLALEDSERTRRACISFMQFFVPIFYPEKKELLCKLHALASQLGGDLAIPQLRGKYAVLRSIVGWKATKKVMTLSARSKFRAIVSVDRLLFHSSAKHRTLA